MKQSKLFSKTRREAPKDEVSQNAILLTRAGYIHKEMAGVYSYLPLGLRVIKKIENIIREEMNAIWGQEVSLSSLQDPSPWKESGRWEDSVLDVWFKTELQSGGEVGLATTHEEPLTRIMSEQISSYRDLPRAVYQFQTKFRNELRAKSGIMRGREFLMKDLYSFSRTQEEHDNYYERVKNAYLNIFNKVGIGEQTYYTLASGGSFSDKSHEFQTVTDAGEDTIFITDEGKKEAVNKEVDTPSGAKEARAIEVGNIFPLGTKFSESLGLYFTDESGEKKPVIMGSYGIGLGRLMGTVAEVLSDDKGLVWPESIAPYQVHLLVMGEESKEKADKVYEELVAQGVEVLYDDRDLRAGEKFADADLIGIPTRVVVGSKSPDLEVVERKSGNTEHMSLDDLIKRLK